MNSDIREIVQRRRKQKSKGSVIKRRVVVIVLAIVGLFLAYEFGHQGYICYYDLEHKYQAEKNRQHKLEERKKELISLTRQYSTIEGKKELGREAGLVDNNEVRIIVLPTDSKESQSSKTTENKDN